MTMNLTRASTVTPAVVLKFDPNVMHHGGLGAIRSLGRLGVPVYGVHEGRWAPAAGSQYLHGRLFWQPDPEQAERTSAGLRKLAGLIGRRAVLIPTDDAGAIFLAERGDELRDSYLFPSPPAALPRRLAGKYSMYQLCQELGVATPMTVLAGSLDEAGEFAALTGFPLIAKLTTPWRAPGGELRSRLRSTMVITGQQELHETYQACERAGVGLMLQEQIPGRPGDDWFFHGYCDTSSVCQVAFTGVKDRSYPAHAGLTSLGHAARNNSLREDITRLLGRLSYRGIVDLDLRRDPRSGEYRLLDFNPRLGAQFRLFRDPSGLDVVRAAYLDLTGQAVAAGEQVEGRRFLVENYDPIGALGYWRSGELGLRSWLNSLRGVDETAWFARDDLMPFGLMCARMTWRAVSRPLTRPGGAAAHRGDVPRYRAGRTAPWPGPGLARWLRPASQGRTANRRPGPGQGGPAGRLADSHRGGQQ